MSQNFIMPADYHNKVQYPGNRRDATEKNHFVHPVGLIPYSSHKNKIPKVNEIPLFEKTKAGKSGAGEVYSGVKTNLMT